MCVYVCVCLCVCVCVCVCMCGWAGVGGCVGVGGCAEARVSLMNVLNLTELKQLCDRYFFRMRCINSLHVYTHVRRQLSFDISKDTNQLGLKIFKYNSCASTGCGPNFCCCWVPHISYV